CISLVFSLFYFFIFFFSSRRRHTRSKRDWSSDVCSSDLKRLKYASTECYIRAVCKTKYYPDRQGQRRGRQIVSAYFNLLPSHIEIGRASCREKCRSRWCMEHEKKKRQKFRQLEINKV